MQAPPPPPQQYATQPGYQQPMQPVQPGPAPRQFQNGVGLGALILGIIALLLCWIPIVGYVSVVLGVIGLVLAIVGFVNVRRGSANNPVVAIIGGILSLVAIVVPWLVIAVFLNAVEGHVDDLTSYSECVQKAETPEQLEACTPK
jgi:hypothetical protein